MNSSYFMDEQTLREVLETVGKTAAAACISTFLSEVVLKTIISARPTEIVVENGIPAALYTVDKKNGPAAVYVSARKSRADWRPAIFFGLIFAGCKYILDYRDKNVANITAEKRR